MVYPAYTQMPRDCVGRDHGADSRRCTPISATICCRALLVCLTSLAPAVALAELRLASVFTDNMVLQRECKVPIWGTADPGTTVDVRLGDLRATATSDSAGHWALEFDSMPTNSKPQPLVVTAGRSTVTRANVVVGDVWLCSGQSNMQMTLHDSAGGDAYAKQHGDNPLIRLLLVPKAFNSETKQDQEGKWTPCTPGAAGSFSAVGFTFGASLAQSQPMKDVPIGLIDSSFGGTAVEGWISAEDLKQFDAHDLGNSLFGKPSEHFNAMIAPLVPFAIRGVVWYQGESNADRAASYASLLSTMIKNWRRDFRRADLPFVIIQLPSYNATMSDHFFTWVREEQARVAATTSDVSLVVTYDTHDGSDLHPPQKLPVGERAAGSALKQVYGEQRIDSSPMFKSLTVEGPRVRVTFNTKAGPLATSDHSPAVRGFMLAGDDGIYRFAEGSIADGRTVIVSADSVAEPKTVRFAWAGAPDANLVDQLGLPAAPFRTDKLPREDTAYVHQPIRRSVKTPAYEVEIDSIGGIRSLGVHGDQFVSNALGMNGGSCIPGFLGPRLLNRIEEVGPTELNFRDAEVKLSYKFAAESVSLSIENKSSNEVVFQIALSPGVGVDDGQPIQLRNGVAALDVVGFDQVEHPSKEQTILKVGVAAGAIRTVVLRPGKG
jgi:sialate O-acetylesterase